MVVSVAKIRNGKRSRMKNGKPDIEYVLLLKVKRAKDCKLQVPLFYLSKDLLKLLRNLVDFLRLIVQDICIDSNKRTFISIFYLQRIAILTKVNVRHNMAILTNCKINISYSQNRVSNPVEQWMQLRSTDPQVPSWIYFQ